MSKYDSVWSSTLCGLRGPWRKKFLYPNSFVCFLKTKQKMDIFPRNDRPFHFISLYLQWEPCSLGFLWVTQFIKGRQHWLLSRKRRSSLLWRYFTNLSFTRCVVVDPYILVYWVYLCSQGHTNYQEKDLWHFNLPQHQLFENMIGAESRWCVYY